MAEQANRSKNREIKDIVITDEDLEKKLITGKNLNTVKSEKKADKAFRNFLTANGCTNTDYWYFEEPELDNFLAKFWLCTRKEEQSDSEESDNDDPEKKNKKYSANSIRSFRYALNRILRNKGHLYNITEKGTSFRKCNEAFKVALKDLKSEGKAEVKSYPEITEDGTLLTRSTAVFFCLQRQFPEDFSWGPVWQK